MLPTFNPHLFPMLVMKTEFDGLEVFESKSRTCQTQIAAETRAATSQRKREREKVRERVRERESE